MFAKKSNGRVILNVGGTRNEILLSTLNRLPQTRLGRLVRCDTLESILELCDDYIPDANEFFFDRNPRSINSILNFYRTGKLHLIDEMCVLAFGDDLEYWHIDDWHLETCCLNRYHQRRDQAIDELQKEAADLRKLSKQQFGDGPAEQFKKRIWDTLENPSKNAAAKIWTAVSIGFILLATLALVLDTVPEFQTANYLYGVIEDNEILAKIEATCTYWFTFEYLLRLSVSPNKWKFVTAGINVIDLLAIFPYYILAILLTIDPSQGDHPWLIMNDLLRILRVIRILKLARNSNGLQSLGYTLRHSYRELGVVALFLSMFVVIFSSLVYFAEKNDDNSNFESIPVAFWWAIITMTSVGYGDMVPTTTVGKLIGTVCCICGVMIVALPIPIIVNTFTEFYKDKTRREKVQKRREAVNRAKRCALPSHVDYVVVEKALPR